MEAIDAFLARCGEAAGGGACLGVAGPVIDGRAAMVNRDWVITEEDLLHRGFDRVLLVNDFEAVANALPHLDEGQVCAIGEPRVRDPDRMMAAVGPGTGFGVAAIGEGRVVASHGGHIGFSPSDDVERAVQAELCKALPRVSVEHVLSGRGLERLHGALQRIEGREASLAAHEITERAAAGDPACLSTADRFWSILASVCGDFALVFEARGGLFVTGGVARALAPFLDAAAFRRRFEAKADLSAFNAGIGTWMIEEPAAALIGAAAAFGTRR
jgi:glucokinase